MDAFSNIGLDVIKTHPRGGIDGKNNYRNTIALRYNIQIVSLSILWH